MRWIRLQFNLKCRSQCLVLCRQTRRNATSRCHLSSEDNSKTHCPAKYLLKVEELLLAADQELGLPFLCVTSGTPFPGKSKISAAEKLLATKSMELIIFLFIFPRSVVATQAKRTVSHPI